MAKAAQTPNYDGLEVGSQELIAKLVEENLGWSTSIAKSVARAWNLDWQLDGLDGGAYEALLFCAGRFDPAVGVPFRGYARRRIHEACTEEARKSKSWHQSTGRDETEADIEARELSAKIFDLFPELRDGFLPASKTTAMEDTSINTSIKQLITGASLISAFQESPTENQENLLDFKHLVEEASRLEPVHQDILYAVYYEGQSMRSLAEEWGLDDLAVIREHKEILAYLSSRMESARSSAEKKLKVRRGLKSRAIELKKKKDKGSFSNMLAALASFVCLILADVFGV